MVSVNQNAQNFSMLVIQIIYVYKIVEMIYGEIMIRIDV